MTSESTRTVVVSLRGKGYLMSLMVLEHDRAGENKRVETYKVCLGRMIADRRALRLLDGVTQSAMYRTGIWRTIV